MKLMIEGLIKLLCGIALMGVLLFWPAGTLSFFGGWLLLGILFVPMLALGAVLLIKSPDLLRRRLDSKEKESTQKGVVAVAGLLFLISFVVAGLDYRFDWMPVSRPVAIGAAVVFLIGYGMYAEVMRENAYLSRTIKVEEGQTVVDTGLYGVMRHPMYTATILMFLAMPLVLGSLIAFFVMLPYPLVIALRIGNEEKVLCQELDGYDAYRQKVKYRLIPFIW